MRLLREVSRLRRQPGNVTTAAGRPSRSEVNWFCNAPPTRATLAEDAGNTRTPNSCTATSSRWPSDWECEQKPRTGCPASAGSRCTDRTTTSRGTSSRRRDNWPRTRASGPPARRCRRGVAPLTPANPYIPVNARFRQTAVVTVVRVGPASPGGRAWGRRQVEVTWSREGPWKKRAFCSTSRAATHSCTSRSSPRPTGPRSNG